MAFYKSSWKNRKRGTPTGYQFHSSLWVSPYLVYSSRMPLNDGHCWRTPHQSGPTEPSQSLDPPSSTTADAGSISPTIRIPVPPLGAIDRLTSPDHPFQLVGLEPNLPLTKLLTHDPWDSLRSVSVLYATSLISYATQ